METMTLTRRADVRLEAKSPFNFAGTVHKPSHFPAPMDAYDDGGFWVPVRLDDALYGVNLRDSAPGVALVIYAAGPVTPAAADALAAEISWRFGLGLDLTEFAMLASRDPVLKQAAERWRGMRPSCAYSLYELCCITTLLQNTVVSRTVSMMRAMLERYGTPVEFGGHQLFAMWTPADLAGAADADLRALKVGYRSTTLLRLADFFARNPGFEPDLRCLPRDDVARKLRDIYGIGPATAWYLLFESMKKLDAFSHVSPWEQKILSRLIFNAELVPADEIREFAARSWGQYSMLAVHYLFEDAFWRRAHEPIPWLEELIRL
jgi:DNA-3-methyladenine glycosylase II